MKIELSPELTKFAEDIGATHILPVVGGGMLFKFVGKKLMCYGYDGKDWYESKSERMREEIDEIDFTPPKADLLAEIERLKAALDKQWMPIESAPHRKAVLVFYKNSLGKCRIIKAKYIEKHTEEACEECVAIGFSDYCEEKDEYFTPEGWYEIIDNGHEYSSYTLEEGNNPTHWMPLPPNP